MEFDGGGKEFHNGHIQEETTILKRFSRVVLNVPTVNPFRQELIALYQENKKISKYFLDFLSSFTSLAAADRLFSCYASPDLSFVVISHNLKIFAKKENILTMNDDLIEEEEEILVVAQFPGLEDMLGNQSQNIVFEIDENGEKLNAIIDDHFLFSGKFEVSLGTQLILEETPVANSNSSTIAAKSVRCIGTSITTVPFELKSTTDIDKLNNAIHNPAKLSHVENIDNDHSSSS